MSLNVNYTSLYKNGIDTSILKEVSGEILSRAAQKSAQFNPSLSTTQQVNAPAKPAELGIDLYNGKIDNNTQKQRPCLRRKKMKQILSRLIDKIANTIVWWLF